jgi:phage tail-like protein
VNELTALNFLVRIELPGEPAPLCEAGFSQCSGLEAGLDLKTIRPGGDNQRQVHLVGRVTYGTLSCKRGMTRSFDLWRWFDRVVQTREHHLRATCTVEMLTTDRREVATRFRLDGCLPTKLRAPVLDAKEGAVAIEELEVAYERLALEVG